MTSAGWLRAERASLAAEQLLDAAGALFARDGIAAVSMADVADAAGCSRATLYRYFDGKDALRTAYVHREARRIGAEVAARVEHLDDPSRRLVEAMAVALQLVRGDVALAPWFTAEDAGGTARLAQSSEVIEGLVAGFLGRAAPAGADVEGDAHTSADKGADTVTDAGTRRRARWVVRVLVSLLADPGADAEDERAMLEEFVAPVVVGGS